MLKLGVLVSGSGTNLQAIIAAIAAGSLAAEIVVVLSNKPEVAALERAKRASIPTAVISHRDFTSRESFDAALVATLRKHGADWVVLAGFMRVVTPVLLDAFADRVVNVHPALLPAFPGAHAQADALAYGVRVTGCTVHLVDAGVDTGPIIAQATVPVLDDDSVESLAARVLAEEHLLLPSVLQWIAEGRVEVERRGGGLRPRVRVRQR